MSLIVRSGRARLLPLRILDAVRRVRHELEALVRDRFSADGAAAVLAALEAREGVVDLPQSRGEHRLTRRVELAVGRLRGRVGGVLVGEGDLSAALLLGIRESLADRVDSPAELFAELRQAVASLRPIHVVLLAQNVGMNAQDLSTRRADVHLLDVREDDEWAAGHIDGAQHIPLGQLGDRLAELPHGRTIVSVCRSGSRSAAAVRGLRQLGYEAENLDGGVAAWTRAGLPLVDASGRAGRVI